MIVQINGAQREFPEGITVEELLQQLGLQGRLVVVELNKEILVREAYSIQVLASGDQLELVHFVGGGR